MLGSVAAMQHNYDEAKADYRTEIKKHPDNAMVAAALADVEKGEAMRPRAANAEGVSCPAPGRIASVFAARSDAIGGGGYKGRIDHTAICGRPASGRFQCAVQLSETLLRLQRG